MKLLPGVLALLCPFLSMCQPIALKGKVINSEGEPVPAATVTLKPAVTTPANNGFATQAVANEAGEFTIPAVRVGDTIIVSATGYELATDLVNERGLVTVILRRRVGLLDEAVVIAYGRTTRRLATGNVAVVTAADIEKQPVFNPLAALQGRVPGLIITQTSGVAGSAFNIQLRGRTSLDLSLTRNDPLIVIDGVPFESGNSPSNLLGAAFNNSYAVSGTSPGGLSPLATINPADIESISVLKDADATAIYGSRGAAGVLLITTKRGKAAKTTVTATVSQGWARAATAAPFLNTGRYIAMRREAFAADGLPPTTATAPDLLLWDTARYTDFGRLLTGGTARTANYGLSLSGGTAATRFTLGSTYAREGSVFPGSFPASRASAQFSLSHAPVGGRGEARLSVIYANAVNRLPYTDLYKYRSLPPNLRLYNADGSLSWQEGGVAYSTLGFTNPLADLLRQYKAVSKNLSANLTLSSRPLRSLTLRLSTGYNTFTTDEQSITPKASIAPENNTLAFSQFAVASRASWIVEPQAEWATAIGPGRLQVLVGGTWQHRGGTSLSVNAGNYTNDLLLTSVAAAGTVTASNGAEVYRYAAAFGRLNYNWANKYLLNLSARRDGSSRFGPGRRVASFGAVGAAWVMSAERWMHGLSFISFAKWRGSWGTTGNDQVGDYRFLDLWTSTTNPYQGIPGLRPAALFNPDFEWEKNTKAELALELGFWADRLTLTVAAFRQRSSNQLVTYRLPNQTGFASVVRNLPALVQNTGLEFTFNAAVSKGKSFTWQVGGNLTVPSNRLLSFPGLAGSSYGSLYVEGASLTVQRKLRFLGVDAATGLYAYEDVDKDGAISTPADLQVGGNLDPRFYGGLSNTVGYQGFSLDVFLQFTRQVGSNYLASQYGTPAGFLANQPALVLDRWRAPGDVAPVQRFTASAANPAFLASYNLVASDGIFSDASFIRLKNVSLAYNLPAGVLRKAKLEGARFYLQGQNLATITGYRGGDPETQSLYQLPPLRTIVAGIQLTF